MVSNQKILFSTLLSLHKVHKHVSTGHVAHHVASNCRITLIEAAELLGTFDEPLREYATNKLHKQGVHLVKVGPITPY